MKSTKLKDFLDEKAAFYNQHKFIESDPICIPHLYTKTQDIEIAGLFAAVFAWGNRSTIIAKCKELLQLMDNSPHDFIINHQETDRKRFLAFKHRTFNATDLLYFIEFLQQYYQSIISLEFAFSGFMNEEDVHVENALVGFHRMFFALEHPDRTRKHISTPERNAACKRLNMFLRWMVRSDQNGVDFGIWKQIKPSQLVCPMDIHVSRVATKLGLIEKPQANWKSALVLTEQLRTLDAADPCKYDFALFGLGVMEKYI
jgi:uncharacterized protein (TIGR02757 family)